MNERVKEITKDAIFIALLTAIIILMKYFFFMLESMLLLVISLFIGVRYHKEKISRMLIVSISLFLISFLYFDILSILIYILPGIILGILSHYFLKIILNVPYYLSSISIYFLVHTAVEIMYSRMLLNLNFTDYLLTGMEFPDAWVSNLGFNGLLLIFLGYNLIMAILESIIIRKGVFLFEILKDKKKHKNNI